jgi:hypothetical protein
MVREPVVNADVVCDSMRLRLRDSTQQDGPGFGVPPIHGEIGPGRLAKSGSRETQELRIKVPYQTHVRTGNLHHYTAPSVNSDEEQQP